jgi:hypothetical protein
MGWLEIRFLGSNICIHAQTIMNGMSNGPWTDRRSGEVVYDIRDIGERLVPVPL